MAESEIPAVLEAEVAAVEPSEVPVKAPEITSDMKLAAQVGVDAAFKAINEQPRVKVRVPKVYGPQTVIINGARFNIPSNVSIEVPQQVAEVLADSGRI